MYWICCYSESNIIQAERHRIDCCLGSGVVRLAPPGPLPKQPLPEHLPWTFGSAPSRNQMLSNVAEHKPRPSLFDGLVRHLQAWCIDACTCSVLVCSARKSNTRALYETVHFVVAQGLISGPEQQRQSTGYPFPLDSVFDYQYCFVSGVSVMKALLFRLTCFPTVSIVSCLAHC